MASSRSQLSALQRDLLDAFSKQTSKFFLTGGAVLAGWVLEHRRTDDLDLFTEHDEAIGDADRLVRSGAATIGATVESVRTAPDFRRYLVRRGDESVVVDFVRERVPQLYPKLERDGLLMDSAEEILVNKLCTLLGRVEIRDLVDLYFLERAGLMPEAFIEQAARKDAGLTPATLAWVLSQFRVPEEIPGGVPREKIEAYARDLEARFRRLGMPAAGGS
jgi:predicted nucleotidyltransferase component of viral defense system